MTRPRDLPASGVLTGLEKIYADNGTDTHITLDQIKAFVDGTPWPPPPPPPAALPVSTYAFDQTFAANAHTGFTSPATKVHSSAVTPKRIYSTTADNGVAVATTLVEARDVEVTTFMGRGFLMLRLDATGRCLYYSNDSITVRIGIKSGFNPALNPESSGTNTDLYVAVSADTMLPGYPAATSVTFGASGFDVYLKYDGVEQVRFKQWQHMESGRVTIAPHGGSGCTDITVNFLTSVALYGDPTNDVYDARDFGMKSLTTVTGSIGAGSNSLVLSSNPGYVVGDTVIVEIGNEAGAGIRGTRGVGGQWPLLSYANATAMNADTTKSGGTWACTLDTGFVYQWDWVAWQRPATAANQGYYSDLMVPKSLVAKITNIAGTTLTLNTTATVAATNANVYLDCLPSFYVLDVSPTILNADSAPDGKGVPYALLPPNSGIVFNIPAGRYATSALMECGSNTHDFPDLIIKGQGPASTELFAPKGTMGAQVYVQYCDGVEIKDFKITGNHAANGYGFDFSAGGATSGVGRVVVHLCPDAIVRNLALHETFSNAVTLSGSNGAWCYDCTVTITLPHRAYVGWQMITTNATGGGFQDCTINASYMTKGYECFAGTDNDFIRCNGTNIGNSVNSSNGWVYDHCTVTITPNSLSPLHTSTFMDEAIFSISANAFGGTGRGARGLLHCNVIQQGFANPEKYIFKPIQIFSNYVNIPITGGYPACPVGTGYGGYYEAPNHDPAHASSYGNLIMSDSTGTAVTGIRMVGAAIGSPGHSSHYSNISLNGSGSSVQNSVADTIKSGPTLTNNKTNAAYVTFCG